MGALLSALDGREPFVLDVRELGRRAGAMMTFERVAAAPTDWSNPMIAVPPGTDVSLDFMAESVIEGVWVSGRVIGTAVGSCSRCLEPLAEPFEVGVEELFRYADLETTLESEELPTFKGDLISLEPTLRDAVVLALPVAPVCSEDCPGLCVECGANLAADPDHQHDQTDPRWDALTKVFGEQSHGTGRDNETRG